MKQGGSKEQYLPAKRKVYTTKNTAEVKKFSDLKPGMKTIFKILKQLRSDNQDVEATNVSKITQVPSPLTTRSRKLLGSNTMSVF